MDIRDALEKFVLQLQADGRSHHTIRQYQRHVRLLDRWLETEGRGQNVESIDHEVVALFMVSEAATAAPGCARKKATSMNALRSSLRTFFAYLHAAGLIRANPARLLRRARCGTPPPRALTKDEQNRLLDALNQAQDASGQRDRVLFRLLLATGVRIGSALALDVDNIDLGVGELWLRKTKGDRPDRVFLPPSAVELLRPFIQKRAGPLFTGRNGGRLSSRHVQRRLGLWLHRAGITRPASPHSLRHSFATRLYESTGDVFIVQQALGHRSILSTLIYAHGSDERLRQALAL